MNRMEVLTACRTELFSAAIADALDSIGYHKQAAMPGLNPLSEGMTIVGYVRTGIYMPIYHDDKDVNVYENEIRLIDDLKPDEVPVLVCDGNLNISPWGELVSTRAQYLGASGCITDGCTRDVTAIQKMGFPVFSAGRNPVDTKYRGKMIWADTPAHLCGVAIASGDLVIADSDGIVFVPAEQIETVVARSLEKVRAESVVRQQLVAGVSLADVFASHGIL
ncbi:MAG: RraA family protein [Rhodobacteraceae bacterium]|nr:RraA family protein [Paracoccaceae bacterium]